MPPGVKGFQKGRAKTGGRPRGVRDKRDVARDELGKHVLLVAGMSADEIDALSPLAVMKLCMTIWLKAGDLHSALAAAQAAAPYEHARLASTDLRIDDQRKRMNEMSDEEVQHEIDVLEERRFSVMSDEELARERELFEARVKAARGNGYH